jgi:thiamine-phosphate pyrophosphorylase
VLLCYVTDRHQFSGSEREKRERLLAKIDEAARSGIDYIQLREKDVSARELEELAHLAVAIIRQSRSSAKLLINSRTDIALACGADGVHLRSDDIPASDVRALWLASAGAKGRAPIIGVSCHSVGEVRLAGSHGADFAVFGPIFEKSGAVGIGLKPLAEACRAQPQPGNTEAPATPSTLSVLAIGGVNLDNVQLCVEAGAAGIAAIRLFQENKIAEVVQRLRLSAPARAI